MSEGPSLLRRIKMFNLACQGILTLSNMFYQKVLKGINGLDHASAQENVDNGITCNWWRTVGTISPAAVKLHLTAGNADLHLNHYHKPIPAGNPLAGLAATFGAVTPFISTTAGAIQRDHILKDNILFDPFITALKFATRNFRSRGFIFYAYLMTIGKVAIEMEQFSEEVRELHIYKDFLPYHSQGEIMAKIIIPSVQIEKAWEFDGPQAKRDLKRKVLPTPVHQISNPAYLDPQRFSNIRELLR